MASLKLIEEHKALAPTSTKVNTNVTAIPLRVRHLDSDAATGTVTITATSLELINDATTSYSLTFDTTNTSIALLKAAVNAKADWECIAIDAIEDKVLTTDSFFVVAAAVATGSQGIGVLYTDTALVVGGSIQNTKFLANDAKVSDLNYVNEVNAINYTSTDSSSTTTVTIYSCREGDADEALYTEALVTTSGLQTLNIATMMADQGITPGYGKRLVVNVDQQTVGGTLNVLGKSYRGS